MAKKDEIAIKVSNVKKGFTLHHEKSSSIKSKIVNIFKPKDKTTEEYRALKGVSFEIKKGEFFGIVGRNGSGKSTLLKILAEIYQPTSGSVEVNGKLIPFIELGVGFNPELTGRENVYLNGALLGFSREQIKNMYDEIVEFAELEQFMDQKLKNYSSGMQVRLAFSVAIKAQGDILVLDEVLAVGDEAFQRKCYEYFQQLREEKKTVILVSHNMEAVRNYCTRAVLLNEGKIEVESSDVMTVADAYSKLFVEKTEISHNEETRFGTGEITLENIKEKHTDEKIVISLDAVNHTDDEFRGAYVGVDFKVDRKLVSGNHLKYAEGYQDGLTFAPKEKKRLALEFDNNLSKNDYTVDINMRADSGTRNFDTVRSALEIQLAKPGGSKFYKIQMPVRVREDRS